MRGWWEIAKRVAPSRHVLVAVADLGVVAAIVSVLVFTALVIVRQGAYDGAATDIAAWCRERDVERVAWPSELREAVPALLDAGVVPVLVNGSEPAQQYAISRTGVVVMEAGAPAPALEVASHRVGDLIAYEVAIDEAGSVPLAVGDTVSEKISRPYRYAPCIRARSYRPVHRSTEICFWNRAGTRWPSRHSWGSRRVIRPRTWSWPSNRSTVNRWWTPARSVSSSRNLW